MCGRYTFISIEQLSGRFDVTFLDIQPRYNIAPTQELPVIIRFDNKNQLALMKWGLIPHWAKDPQIGGSMINARAETLGEKPAFKSLLKSKRCLIPADGFYEWKKAEKSKQPYYIQLKDYSLFAFAGLYDSWQDSNGTLINTYTVITTTANPLISPLHDRMPAILKRSDEAAWLDNHISDLNQLKHCLNPYPSDELSMYPVSLAVNTPKNDNSALIKPL